MRNPLCHVFTDILSQLKLVIAEFLAFSLLTIAGISLTSLAFDSWACRSRTRTMVPRGNGSNLIQHEKKSRTLKTMIEVMRNIRIKITLAGGSQGYYIEVRENLRSVFAGQRELRGNVQNVTVSEYTGSGETLSPK